MFFSRTLAFQQTSAFFGGFACPGRGLACGAFLEVDQHLQDQPVPSFECLRWLLAPHTEAKKNLLKVISSDIFLFVHWSGGREEPFVCLTWILFI